MSASASSSSAATLGSLPSERARPPPTAGRAPARAESALKIGRISAASSPCWSLRAWPRQSRRKCTVQRCQGHAEHPGDRGLEPLVGVGDDELHADQAARHQRAQELGPERLRLGLADVDAEDLAAPGLVHAVGDHDTPCARRGRRRAPSRPWRPATGTGSSPSKRALTERPHLLVQLGADPRHLRARDPAARATPPAGRRGGSRPRTHRPAARPPAAPVRSAGAAPGTSGK